MLGKLLQLSTKPAAAAKQPFLEYFVNLAFLMKTNYLFYFHITLPLQFSLKIKYVTTTKLCSTQGTVQYDIQ